MSHKDFWISILNRLQPTIKKAHFLTWFQNTAILDCQNGELKIGLPNVYSHKWISTKYDVKVLQAAQEVKGDEIQSVVYVVDGSLDSDGGLDVKTMFDKKLAKKVRKVRNVNEVQVTKPGTGEKVSSKILNNRFKLDSFVVGLDNRLPHAACKAVGSTPGGIYNPLYIYGSVGLGKTHLLQAIGNEVLKNFPDMVVQYITAERFVTEVVEAIGKRNMKKFKQKYRNVDCFLVDDVQFFRSKNSSQQEFFHTFNALVEANKQIVLTSDRPPSELDDLDTRLKSRFSSGMVVELLLPDFETRLAILQQKCQEYAVILDPEVMHFIAMNVKNSVRELEGILKQVIADIQLFERLPTIRSVAEIIRRMDKAQEIIGYDLEGVRDQKMMVKNAIDVMEIVAQYYNVTVDDLVGKSRQKDIMAPRQMCMYLIKNELSHSYGKIGMGFGGRNHTTVMHSCNKTAERLRNDVRLVRDLNAIKREMGL